MLEGPGSQDRLTSIQRRFARASARPRRGRTLSLVLMGVLTFVATVAGGLALMDSSWFRNQRFHSDLAAMTRNSPGQPLQAGPTPLTPSYVRSCQEAERYGLAPIPARSPLYRPELDADSDGEACEPYTPRVVRRFIR